MDRLSFKCPKCGNSSCEVGEMHVAGGTWSKVFDFENRKFTTVVCGRCRYTEIYQVESSKLSTVFDFITT